MGELENLWMTYNIQEDFQMEGYFMIKFTPIGANHFLLEEGEEGELKALVNEACEYLAKSFKEFFP